MKNYRTCIITGAKKHKYDMYKLVILNGTLVVDFEYQIYQKSSYITKDIKTLKKFVDEKGKFKAKHNLKKNDVIQLLQKEILD